jgi:hypothetical protein
MKLLINSEQKRCRSANLNTTSLKVLNLLLDSKSNLVACLKPGRDSRNTSDSINGTAKCYYYQHKLRLSVEITNLGWSFLTKDQLRIVTGPVNIPFIGRDVMLCAIFDQKTVMGLGRLTSP